MSKKRFSVTVTGTKFWTYEGVEAETHREAEKRAFAKFYQDFGGGFDGVDAEANEESETDNE